MEIKKLTAVLITALLLASGMSTVSMPVSAFTSDINSLMAYQQKTITLDASKGATADDLQKALKENHQPNYYFNGEDRRTTIKLVGTFQIDKTISLYSGFYIDASQATIKSNADLVFSSYAYGGIYFKSGKYELGKNTRLLKLTNLQDITIDGLTVNSGGSFDYGVILMYHDTKTLIKNCTFNNTTSQAIFIHGGYESTVYNNHFNNINGHAVCVYGGENDVNGNLVPEIRMHDLSIIGNNINGACGDGIKCVRCGDNCNISGNTIKKITLNNKLDYDELKKEARSGVGIMIMECIGVNVGKQFKYDGKTFEGNTVVNTENYGMVVNLSDGVKVRKNSFTDIGTNGLHNSASSRTTVENCSFKNCKEIGIFFIPGPVDSVADDLKTCKNAVIRNNTIDTCGSFGIDLAKTVGSDVSNNTIFNCKDYAVYCIGAKNATISGNSTANTKSINGSGIGYNSESSGIKISNNKEIKLTLNQTSMSLGKGETATLKASVINMNDQTIKWRTSNSKILTVTQNGKVTAVGNGTAWITARSTSGIEKSCKITVKNAPEKITLTKGILTLGVGEKFTLGSGINDGAACSKRTYRTSNSSIVKMTRTDWNGDFYGVKPGIAYVTVRTYNGKESTCKVTVKPAPSSVTISKKTLTLKVGQTATLGASIPSNAGCATRTFRTSNNNILQMTKTNWTGTFKALKPGTAYVTVRTYNGKESSCKVTVVK